MILRGTLIALALCLSGLDAAHADTPCKLVPIGPATGSAAPATVHAVPATVRAVHDGRTVVLSDGRELLLAAIEVTELSRPALEAAIGGRPLRLAKLGEEFDRYGRIVAFAFPGESRTSLQETLLAQGQARVAARVGDMACAAHLKALERDARRAGLGQWANLNFAPLPAQNFPRLEAERGHFVLIEGKVLSVRESGATTYVNFGRRWAEALTVTISRREVGRFAAAGLDPKRLEGRRLLVRGILEQRTGPTIEAVSPEQIELID